MTSVTKYRLFCQTENLQVYTDYRENTPFTCPNNHEHTIDINSIVEIDTISEKKVIVQEENGITGGHFREISISVNAIANTSSYTDVSFPYPISALSVSFVASSNMGGDFASLLVGPFTPIGILTSNIGPISQWTSQNYAVGDMVLITHPIKGNCIYTCHTNTITNDSPLNLTNIPTLTNNTYWTYGICLNVSSTAVLYAKPGYLLRLDDDNNPYNDVCLEVISVDNVNNKLYAQFYNRINEPTPNTNFNKTYLTTSPTYIKQTVAIVLDYEIPYTAWEHTIGTSKIGGSFIPADTIVRIMYKNISNTDKKFIATAEFLY